MTTITNLYRFQEILQIAISIVQLQNPPIVAFIYTNYTGYYEYQIYHLIHVDAYLTEMHMSRFVNFSRDWKESGNLCFELVDLILCVF